MQCLASPKLYHLKEATLTPQAIQESLIIKAVSLHQCTMQHKQHVSKAHVFASFCWLLLCRGHFGDKHSRDSYSVLGQVHTDVHSSGLLNVWYTFKRPLDKLLHCLSSSKLCPWVIYMWLLTLGDWNSSLNYLYVYSL